MTVILALDLATRFGWCVDGAEQSVPPRTGSVKLPGQGRPDFIGVAGLAFAAWLSEHIVAWRPDALAFEAPAHGGAGIRMHGNIPRLLFGLAFQAEVIAHAFKIGCEEAAAQTVRHHFLGHGRPPNPKRAVVERCRLLGWPVVDHNAGDALALWHYAKCRRDRGFRHESGTPLFIGKVA